MSIRQRLYANETAVIVMIQHCSDSRFIWNLGLEQRNLYRKHAVSKIDLFSQSRELTEARKEFEWMASGSRGVQQQALRDLDQAFRNWWSNPSHFGRPTWRKAGLNESFRVVDIRTRQINRKWGEVQIPKFGWVRFRLTRPWNEITVTKSAIVKLSKDGHWYITFTSPQPVFERVSTNREVGLDMGIAVSVATSDGEMLQVPKLLSDDETQRKLRLQRRLSRQGCAGECSQIGLVIATHGIGSGRCVPRRVSGVHDANWPRHGGCVRGDYRSEERHRHRSNGEGVPKS